MIVANASGEVVESVMLENDQTLTVERPDGLKDDNIQVALLLKPDFGQDDFIFIQEYHDVIPGELTFTGYQNNSERESLGTATIAFTIPEGHYGHLATENVSEISSRSWWNNDGTHQEENTLSIVAQPANTFIRVTDEQGNGVPRYSWLNNIQVGDTYSLEEKDFTKMTLWQDIALPPNEYSYLSIHGTSATGTQYNVQDKTIRGGAATIAAYIPGETLADYQYGLRIDNGQMSYYLRAQGKPQRNYQMPQVELQNVVITDESFSARTDYQANYSGTSWEYYYYDDNKSPSKNIGWDVFGNKKDEEILNKRIALPAEITGRYRLLQDHLGDLTYRATTLYNRENGLSTDDQLKTSYPAADAPESKKVTKYESVTFYHDTENCRTAQQPATRRNYEEIKQQMGIR